MPSRPQGKPRKPRSRSQASGTRAAVRSGPTPRAFRRSASSPSSTTRRSTIQLRRFDTLLQALGENRADAVIASLAVTPETRLRVDFSDPYYRATARFVARRDSTLRDAVPEAIEGKKIAILPRTAHEQYLKAFFTEAELKPYPTMEAARDALRKGEVDLLFGDGIALAFWLNGTDSANCCKFVGGAFTESRYFGEGVGIAVRRGNDTLRLAFNWALFRLWEKGRFTDLWLRYFPISPF
jgi:polar amino acid transport system substrate-binding protein